MKEFDASALDFNKAVDLTKVYALDREVKETLRLLQANDAKRLMPAFYGKAIVMMASRYIDLNAIQDAMKLLVLNAPQFYRDDLPALMQNDPDFRKLAVKVADAMVEHNIVVTSYTHEPRYELAPAFGRA